MNTLLFEMRGQKIARVVSALGTRHAATLAGGYNNTGCHFESTCGCIAGLVAAVVHFHIGCKQIPGAGIFSYNSARCGVVNFVGPGLHGGWAGRSFIYSSRIEPKASARLARSGVRGSD
jgi:hypothetical protein